MGFKCYFTNAWCWIDFIIVMVALIGVIASAMDMGVNVFRTIRVLRALRPLRLLSRFKGIRVVVSALVSSIPSIFNVILVCLVFWLIFSILGVQLFGGKFYKCLYDNGTRLGLDIVKTKNDCLQLNYYMMIYFVLFIVFGSFFTLNLFIGVTIENFSTEKKRVSGGALELLMSDDQKKYYRAMKKMCKRKPKKALPRPKFRVAQFFFDVTMHPAFEFVILAFIFLNMVTMCVEHNRQSATLTAVLYYFNHFFISMFTMECVMKLIALHWRYFTEPWNVFDFIVIVISILGTMLADIIEKYFASPTLLRVLRVMRIGRVFRLIKGARGLRTLLISLASSLPALFNVGLLLFLVMYIYSIFGMSFFAYVKHTGGITELFNFETFGRSMILLFQMCTSSGWSTVLEGLSNNTPPGCDRNLDNHNPNGNGNCGNRGVAVGFLVSYLVITFLVMVNIYIAVILENFSQAREEVQQGLTDDDYDLFLEHWQKDDPKRTYFIPLDRLSDFVAKLNRPLGVPKPNQLQLTSMDIAIFEGEKVHCMDILNQLTKYRLGRPNVDPSHDLMAQDIAKRPDCAIISSTLRRKRERYCARIIVNAFRHYMQRKRLVETNREQARTMAITEVFSNLRHIDSSESLHCAITSLNTPINCY